ncbi:Putative component of multidrug efflux pump, acrB/acrD/acrF family [Agrobacterium tumefaciens]|nr:Putative component of multidrug efflux pump, acrB/acrD/acrF family [Agrobacterium tumefaciens]
MAVFFIDRPVFAWVLAIAIMLAGAISVTMLPISQYPNVAPPQIRIAATYPGASPEDTYEGVTRLIEDELNGIPGLLYYESTSDSSGQSPSTLRSRPEPTSIRRQSKSRTAFVESRRGFLRPSCSRASASMRQAPAHSCLLP